MTSTSLTLRRQKFVSEYVETGNATEAARLAGYSPRTAYSQGSRLLTFVEVQQAIETERQTLRARVERDQEQLVRERHQLKGPLRIRYQFSVNVSKVVVHQR